jgi:4-hydroxy-4-methyl-2-oxoglutarate aldolase
MSAADGSGMPPDLAAVRLYAAVVSDILDDLGHRDHALDPAIRPLSRGAVIAGPANPFLVTEIHQIPAEPYAGEIGALDDIRPGEVILVAAGGSARAACWGELFSAAARARGARGTLIDGYCRDGRRIAARGYPVWCRGRRHPRRAHRGDHQPGPGRGSQGARAAGRAGGRQHAASCL